MANGSVRINVPKLELQTAFQKSLTEVVGEARKNKIATRLIAEMSEPYVPIGNAERIDAGYGFGNKDFPGSLRASVHATEKLVTWDTPYAHYMWEGIVYGPNIPIYANGDSRVIVGYRSPKGKGTKSSTGRAMEYYALKASSHWVYAMLKNERRRFNNRVSSELQKIARSKNKR